MIHAYVMPSLFGKSSLSMDNDLFHDVDEILNHPDYKDELKALRRDAVKTGDWTLNNSRYAELVEKEYKHANNIVILLHSSPVGLGLDDFISGDTLYTPDLEDDEYEKRLKSRLATVISSDRGQSEQLYRMNRAGHAKHLKSLDEDMIYDVEDAINYFESLVDEE